MARWHDALRAYRRKPLVGEPLAAPKAAMFVLCSEQYAASELIAACEPAVVLQTLGGAADPTDDAIRATFEDAVISKGVRHVIVCGHRGCRALGGLDLAHAAGDQARAAVAAQCAALRADEYIGRLLREHRVVVRALWFDEDEGDVYACHIEGARAEIMSDEDFARLLATFTPTAA